MKADKAELPLYDAVNGRGLFVVFGSFFVECGYTIQHCVETVCICQYHFRADSITELFHLFSLLSFVPVVPQDANTKAAKKKAGSFKMRNRTEQ